MLVLTNFAESAKIHVTLKPDIIFKIGPIAVTNSILYGLICGIFMAGVLIWASKKIKINGQKGFPAVVDLAIDIIISMLESTFHSRKKAVKYAPIFAYYLLFILFANLLELVPWVGEGLHVVSGAGKTVLFRPFTADLNGTIAMSIIAIVLVQILSVKEQGFKKHLQHYFSNKPWNPINFFIGLLEVFGEFTRILSLSLRLFLNTAVGEILITVFTSLILEGGRTPLAVIPILLFEMLVAGIQAYVFTILSATYLELAIAHGDESHSEEPHSFDSTKEVDSRASSGG